MSLPSPSYEGEYNENKITGIGVFYYASGDRSVRTVPFYFEELARAPRAVLLTSSTSGRAAASLPSSSVTRPFILALLTFFALLWLHSSTFFRD